MDALKALHTRVSAPRLGGDPPDDETLEKIFKAALRAPDHGLLRPWRFLVVRGDDRRTLGELFAQAAADDDPDIDEAALDRARQKPFRAPMIVIAISRLTSHPKVPEVEQIVSTGAAIQNMMVAAYALGVGAMWRTGGMAYHPVVTGGLGLESNERIVGYVYLGRVEGRVKRLRDLDVDEFFRNWP